jgi:hypothetical protein
MASNDLVTNGNCKQYFLYKVRNKFRKTAKRVSVINIFFDLFENI